MIILFGNIKGGVGKSTLTIALANYLTQEHRRWVEVLDLDNKQTLVEIQQKTRILETVPLYRIHHKDLINNVQLLKEIQINEDKILLIDVPTYLSDDSLMNIIIAADLVICPFSYDQFTISSTLHFSLIISKLNPRAALLFVPNRIKTSSIIEMKKDIEKVLSNFGPTSVPINDKIDFHRITNLHTPVSLLPIIMPVFDSIYDQYIFK